jgi:TRAP-type C4-dicarboxylate transport system substrate-binding protein
MIKVKLTFGILVLCAIFIQPIYGITIKLGSIAPEGSAFDTRLKRITAEWYKITGGTVRVKIYPGGIVGDEPNMIRKMRIGQLQAAIFTGMGMSYISPEVLALQMPWMVENDRELDHILRRTKSYFEGKMRKKGFVVVAWSKVGWVHFFSKKPVYTPADLKRQKFAVSTDNPQLLQSWRAIGFNAVPMGTNDMMAALQSGMIEAYYSTPLAAASFQWFAYTKNMCSMKIAPLIGGIVIHESAWNKIPKKYHSQLKQTTQRIVDGLYAEILALDRKALATMKKHGLRINRVTPQHVQQWKREAEKGYGIFIGKTFSRDLYNRLKKIIAEYRKR